MPEKPTSILMGAACGDIIGSVYEHRRQKSTEFSLFSARSRFTDDTVLTVAVADAILNGEDYAAAIRRWGRRYPHAGYGGFFRQWLQSDDAGPYNSFGNGSAMRVSPVGWAFSNREQTLYEAERSAAVTHNHPEGIKGAQAVALAIYLARHGAPKDAIRSEIEAHFGYNLQRSVETIRPDYHWDVTCQGSVPESIVAFLDADDYESTLRNAISYGGDADTMAAIAGSIAEAFYGGVPEALAEAAWERLPGDMRQVIDLFRRQSGFLSQI